MSVTSFLGGTRQILDNNGDPLAGGKVFFYAPGTSTPRTTYSDSGLTTANSNPVILDANGRATIWLTGPYDVVVKTSADVTVWSESSINPDQAVAVDNFNLVTNGNFERNTSGDGVTPDDWVLTIYGTAALSTSEVRSGSKSISFTSTGAGGGSAQNESYFIVSPSRNIRIDMLLKATAANVRVIARLTWYDASFSQVSTTDAYDEAAAVPTSWTAVSVRALPPTTARYGKVTLIGADPSNGNSGTVYFDDVAVYTERLATLPVGTVLDGFFAAAPSGYLLLAGETFGSATSGATHADSAYHDLFIELHASLTDAESPMLDSGGSGSSRSGDAEADWAADKRMTLPDSRGRVAIAMDNLNGSSANVITDAQADVLGGTAGAATHTLVTPEMPAHDHGVTGTFRFGSGQSLISGAASVGFITDPIVSVTFSQTGGGQPHANVQPYLTVRRVVAY